MLQMKCPQTLFQHLKKAWKCTHIYLIWFMQTALKRLKQECDHEQRWSGTFFPGLGVGAGGFPVTWAEACGQARSHLQGTHSVSCLKAWASSPTADSLDTTDLPILTPFTTCLLLYPHFRDAQLPAISGLGSPGEGEQRELWEAPSLGGSWRCPSTFIFRTRHRSRPT